MSAPKEFRPDIEGLRAIAIAAVVLYHAGVPILSGGFVGVDLFFVLSGFLITGLLTQELAATSTIGLAEFWARRVRRLLPAATVVLLATVAASFVWMPPTLRAETAYGVGAAALYASNWFFALNALDYLNAEDAPSPSLHFWSLGVEEQFYAFWPVLLLVAVAVLRGRRWRKPLFGMTAVIWCASFAASVYYSQASQPIAFFSSPTRFWQLATGAMLAIAIPWWDRRSLNTHTVVQLLGFVLLIVSVFSIGNFVDRGFPYPGVVALLPSVGAAMLVAGGTLRRRHVRPSLIEALLSSKPMLWLGGLSYSLYLWHWPVLVFGARALGTPTLLEKLGLVLVALGLAWLTHMYIENPLRRLPMLARRPGLSLAFGAGLMAVTCAGAALLWTTDATRVEAQTPKQARTFTPLPSAARNDLSAVYSAGCVVPYNAVEQPDCSGYGRKDASQRMVLFGDSHAASVFPAFNAVARRLGYQLDVRIKLGCTVADVTPWHFKFSRPFTQCVEWRRAQLQDLIDRPADVVVVVNANNPTPQVFDEATGGRMEGALATERWIEGYASTLRTLRDAGSLVVMLRDNPRVPGNIADCVSQNMSRPAACNFSRSFGLVEPAADVAAARSVPGVRKIDLSDRICNRTTCLAVARHILAWQKGNHYTATFARSLTPTLTKKLGSIVNATAPRLP